MFRPGHKDKLMEEVMQNEDFSELLGEKYSFAEYDFKILCSF